MALALAAFGLAPMAASPGPRATATPDPLATPALPANPSPAERGRELYYYHCMPCHGDRGQGLTEAWRAVWVHDHQNCWASGCHAGRAGDEGFAIPRTVPAVAGVPGALARFDTAGDLYDYLERTHPPQEPGRLSAQEYRQVTAYLLELNGRPAIAPASGPAIILAATAVLSVGLLIAWLVARR